MHIDDENYSSYERNLEWLFKNTRSGPLDFVFELNEGQRAYICRASDTKVSRSSVSS